MMLCQDVDSKAEESEGNLVRGVYCVTEPLRRLSKYASSGTECHATFKK